MNEASAIGRPQDGPPMARLTAPLFCAFAFHLRQLQAVCVVASTTKSIPLRRGVNTSSVLKTLIHIATGKALLQCLWTCLARELWHD
ncbi:hypothetical protein [Roseinatronobacter alkalisoli]|uniref:Secreted protein n=1 Tax=Roseinatronobacter alkalisoli TaxID=3028235 RepID=A0ABT5T5T1_9RHOB|nr:hypothetical protein [Roseinatronobacter sp. HJB301]MDD7970469.1 hypothetical protein [Roseinatronobacter sp. HJB301]